jgi:hypothetical protein
VWQNVAYGIDFDASTVEFYHSTGGDKLVSKAGPMKASVSSNGADWHVGVLKFSKTKEDWFFSSVYIEDGELTTSVGGSSGGAAPVKASSSAVASKAPVTTSSSTVAAVKTTSSKVVVSSATTVKSSASAVPTTMQTSVKSIPTSTAPAQPAPTSTYGGSCAVEYVYV